jgi:ABC-type glycerol-3-phosphate transport system permease component
VRRDASSLPYRILVQAVFICISLTIVFSLYYLIANSLKTSGEFQVSQFSPPARPAVSNFSYVWAEGGIGITFRNSLIICGTSVLFSMAISLLSGYAFSFLRFGGKRLLSYLILSTMYVSPMALIIPLFMQFGRLHLTNTYIGIILIYVGLNLAYSIYLMTTYMRSIPGEIVEAAFMDGCGHMRLLTRILVPLSKAGVIVLGIITFSLTWNDLLFAFIFLQDEQRQTIMVAIAKFQGMYGQANMTHVLAALVIAAVPVVVLYLLAQRYFREGVIAGSVK